MSPFNVTFSFSSLHSQTVLVVNSEHRSMGPIQNVQSEKKGSKEFTAKTSIIYHKLLPVLGGYFDALFVNPNYFFRDYMVSSAFRTFSLHQIDVF